MLRLKLIPILYLIESIYEFSSKFFEQPLWYQNIFNNDPLAT